MKKIYIFLIAGLLTGIPLLGQEKLSLPPTDENKIYSDLSINFEKKDISSPGKKDGQIHIKVDGGKAPYTITYFTPNQIPQTLNGDQVFLNNLPSGEYIIVVQDSNKEIVYKSITLVVNNNK